MSLKDSGRLKVFACDGEACSFEWRLHFHPSETGAHAKLLRADGWRTVKMGRQFKHFCPNCEPPGGFAQYQTRKGKKARKAQGLPEQKRRWRADIDG